MRDVAAKSQCVPGPEHAESGFRLIGGIAQYANDLLHS